MPTTNLYDTATIRMGGKCDNLTIEGCNDKLNLVLRDTFYTLLNDMIPILITDTFHD